MDRSCITVESVSNLEGNGKRLLEDLLGHRLQDNQQVFIMVLSPGTEPNEAARREARLGVEATFRKTEAYAAEHGVSGDAIDAAIEEAMRQAPSHPEATPCPLSIVHQNV
jgi:hypothetical protein